MKKRTVASIAIGLLFGSLLGINADRVYMNGMFVDNDLLETLTKEQYNSLTSNHSFDTSAIYRKGNDAYIVNNKRPNYISMLFGSLLVPLFFIVMAGFKK